VSANLNPNTAGHNQPTNTANMFSFADTGAKFALRVEEEVFLKEELIVGWVGVTESQAQHNWL